MCIGNLNTSAFLFYAYGSRKITFERRSKLLYSLENLRPSDFEANATAKSLSMLQHSFFHFNQQLFTFSFVVFETG